ncbi:unnamed protein product [Parnassius apollo]|uniref:(apollo) hypothetical protein n=1 Tax=Parnassius apollo TaxID=110799 RepID=A0A8S3YFZ9_PARAO|nr:unnamed protein product [Parnassius apollo]
MSDSSNKTKQELLKRLIEDEGEDDEIMLFLLSSNRNKINLLYTSRYEEGSYQPNQTKAISCRRRAPTTPPAAPHCRVLRKAGSRYEQDNDLGATHFIRAMSASSGCAYSGFGKMRLLHQRGAFLTCTSDRQSVAFTLRCTLDDFPELKHYLLDTAVRCCFYEWEVTDIKPFIKDNLLRINPEQRVMDLLQRAFWAGPLGNSVFCEESRVDGMLGIYLKDFVKNFRSDSCSVTSVGLPYEETLKLAEKIEFSQDKSCAREIVASFPRAGFEYYDLGRDSDVWIAVAVPGCGASDIRYISKNTRLFRWTGGVFGCQVPVKC